jgi:glucosylceramidase
MVCVNLKTGKATLNPEFHIMRHFSHFVKPGAVRLGLAGHWCANAVGFENPDGSTVVVLANPLWEKKTVTVSLPGGRWEFSLPPRSVHTLSSRV